MSEFQLYIIHIYISIYISKSEVNRRGGQETRKGKKGYRYIVADNKAIHRVQHELHFEIRLDKPNFFFFFLILFHSIFFLFYFFLHTEQSISVYRNTIDVFTQLKYIPDEFTDISFPLFTRARMYILMLALSL